MTNIHYLRAARNKPIPEHKADMHMAIHIALLANHMRDIALWLIHNRRPWLARTINGCATTIQGVSKVLGRR